MEQLPLTFVQSTVEPEIQECFNPAFNFTKLSSSNGRLAFTNGKIYWLPDSPMALLDQGWVIKVSEIDSYAKYGAAGFSIKLTDGKELRFSNVGTKMRESISAAIEAHRGDVVEDAPAAAEAAPKTAPEADSQAAPEAEPAAAPAAEAAPEDISADKLMGVLAYLGILVLIPLFAAKDSKFARFHVNQGLILFICSLVIFTIGKLIPGLSAIIWILDLVVFVFAIIGIVNVVNGKTAELPLIGKFRIIQ